MIANTQQINPMLVITGSMEYPENIKERLEAKINLQAFDALSLAEKAGNFKVVKRRFCYGFLVDKKT